MRNNTARVIQTSGRDKPPGSFRYKREAYKDAMRREILSIVDALTPPSCRVCTTREVMVGLTSRGFDYLTLQKISGHLLAMQHEHFVEGSDSGKLHLWSLTQTGRRWAREHPPAKKAEGS